MTTTPSMMAAFRRDCAHRQESGDPEQVFIGNLGAIVADLAEGSIDEETARRIANESATTTVAEHVRACKLLNGTPSLLGRIVGQNIWVQVAAILGVSFVLAWAVHAGLGPLLLSKVPNLGQTEAEVPCMKIPSLQTNGVTVAEAEGWSDSPGG